MPCTMKYELASTLVLRHPLMMSRTSPAVEHVNPAIYCTAVITSPRLRVVPRASHYMTRSRCSVRNVQNGGRTAKELLGNAPLGGYVLFLKSPQYRASDSTLGQDPHEKGIVQYCTAQHRQRREFIKQSHMSHFQFWCQRSMMDCMHERTPNTRVRGKIPNQ